MGELGGRPRKMSRRYILIPVEQGTPCVHLVTTLRRLAKHIGVHEHALSDCLAKDRPITFEGRRYYLDHEL